MKISENILSIPPYISTSWDNISSIQMIDNKTLSILLTDNTKIHIPNLSQEDIEKIFEYHALAMENPSEKMNKDKFNIDLGNADSLLSGFENFTGIMQHDPSQSDGPNLPDELLKKMSDLGKVLGIDTDTFNISDGEPHCNCPYCQISNAIHSDSNQPVPENADEEVTKEELIFREWNIEQKNDKLYHVINPFNQNEKYSVYLGDPIGCTCGKNNCEHILAVLKS